MNVYEMEGFMRGKGLPGDLLVGESNAAYLVRKLNEATAVKAERDALAQRSISIVEDAANKIAYAVFNLSDKSLDDLNPGLCDTTCPTDSALLAERRLRAFAAELREAK
ncbi:hypothetical protein [Serratia liquefaciens]|uniref:hypothetical protein n=1 Tax=Serratia liquefaciens TaxID=614 RepID=UPI000696BC9D|nr:hypothetical protein [Serratia liquefaciens]